MDEKYLPILLKIESIIIEEYNQEKIGSDSSVKFAIEALIYRYKKGRDKNSKLTPSESILKEKIETELNNLLDHKIGYNTISKETVLTCLNNLKKSIAFWSKTNGPKGYLEYVKCFIGKNAVRPYNIPA